MTQRDAIWKNRIIGQGEKPASQFLANDKNWRLHPQAQREALHGALNEVGWVAPVIENRRTGMLVDGHERVWQALQNGDAAVPFVAVDLDEAEEAYVLATLDPIGAMAAADAAKLDDLLREVQKVIRGVAHRRADHYNLVTSSFGLDDALGDPADPVGVGHRRSAVFLHDERHGRPFRRSD